MTTYTRPRILAVADLRPGDEIAFTLDRLPLDDLAEITAETLWLAITDVRAESGDDEEARLDLDGWPATVWLWADRVVVREPTATPTNREEPR